MELKNDSIREVIKKEGIGSAEDKFGKELLTSELKKDFELVKEILEKQPSSAFDYSIYRLLPLEVSRFFEKDILEFAVNRIMQENPTANRENVSKIIKKDYDKSIVRREYFDKSAFYNELYLGIDYANEKYGKDKIDAILKADPKLRQNLVDFGRIQDKEETATVEVEQLLEEEAISVEEEQKVEETPVEEPESVEEETKTSETLKEEPVSAEGKNSKPIDSKKLSPKAIKLIKKVKMLCEKCANENNIVKKHLLKFKLRMLTTRLQEEIDLYYLKEEYRLKQEEIKAKTALKQKDDMLAIININRQIKQRENILKSYSEYDYYSPDFMFPKSLVEKYGGINEFAKQLEEDENPTLQIAGKNISGTLKYREQIQDFRNQIDEKQKEIELREKEAFEESAKINYMEEENHIALKEPNIIFTRIKEIFRIARISIQDFKTEIKERRELTKEYKQKEEELKEQFDLQMQQLREDANKAKNSSITKRDAKFIERMRENVTDNPTNENTEPEVISEKESESRQEDESEPIK